MGFPRVGKSGLNESCFDYQIEESFRAPSRDG